MGVDPAQPQAKAGTPDFEDIWKAAIQRYEDITAVKLQSIAKATKLDDVLQVVHDKETKFKTFRHDGSRVDRFRGLLAKSLKPVEALAHLTASAAQGAFPPSMAVFSAVRYLVSSVNAVSADYDKVTGFFEDLDLYLNRLKILQEWAPPVPELQKAVVEVLASVLVLSGISAKYIKTNRIVKAFKHLASGEDSELTTAYAHFHKMVEQEAGAVRNATLAGVEQVKQQNTAMHTDLQKGFITLKVDGEITRDMLVDTAYLGKRLKRMVQVSVVHQNQEAAAEREEILKGLSSLEFHDRQRAVFDLHYQGTGQWLLDTKEFHAWSEQRRTSTLWCPGIRTLAPPYQAFRRSMLTELGCSGSTVVNHLEETNQNRNVAVTYIYCDYKDPETQSQAGIIASITRQLAERINPLPPEVKDFHEKKSQRRRNPTDEERIVLLKSLCLNFEKTFVCIDALDVCPEINRESLVSLLQKIAPSVRLFITSRLYIDLQPKFIDIFRVNIVANPSDIKAYLRSVIETNRRLSLFTTKDPKLKEDIVNAVNENADGMFLLAYLQIGTICGQLNAKAVRRIMKSLPQGVFETYQDALKRIEDQSEEECQLAKRALSYIFCARRPLRLDELRHALAVEPEDTDIDDSALLEPEILLNISAGLIRVDENSQIVSLIHHTLQEYLESNRGRLVPDVEIDFAKACITYLSFDVFGNGPCHDAEALDRRLEEYQFLDYAARNWGFHLPNSQIWLDLLLPYLEDEQKLASSTQIMCLAPPRSKDWHSRFPKDFNPLHMLSYFGQDGMFAHFLDEGIDVNGQDSYGGTCLHVAARNGHAAAVRCLIEKGAKVDLLNNKGQSALHPAARHGHKNVIDTLLDHGADVMSKDDEGWRALDWAVVDGYHDVVKALLRHGLDHEDNGRNKALILASQEGHEITVQMLLDHGANADFKDWLGSTALDFAAPGGHEATVRALLQHGARTDLKDVQDNTVLHWGVPYEPIVKLLLQSGADANAQNNRGQTALSWVARDAPIACAELLLAHGANVNVPDIHGCTAVHGAALKGREDMLRLLLDHGGDPNVKDKDGWTPLYSALVLKEHDGALRFLREKTSDNGKSVLEWWEVQKKNRKRCALIQRIAEEKAEGSNVMTGLREAVQEKQFTRIQILLDKGADVNGLEIGGWSALTIAADHNYVEGAQLLLHNGADVNMGGAREWTALHWGAEKGCLLVIRVLVAHGADIDSWRCGWTALLLAAKGGHSSTIQFLVEKGADVTIDDYYGRTSLHWAAEYGTIDVISLLLDKGAAVNAVDQWGRTALIWATEFSQRDAVRLLIDKGADVNIKAADGITALHIAVHLRAEGVVQLLLESDANFNAETEAGLTPLHIAAFRGSEPIVQSLLARQANTEAPTRWQDVEKACNDEREDHEKEYDDGVDRSKELKYLNRVLCRQLLDRQTDIKVSAGDQASFTPKQLGVGRAQAGVPTVSVT
ncbi:MAG: hypothetical protein Q9220_000088 [cf. Caloplaca sp. 1 TL-2023]